MIEVVYDNKKEHEENGKKDTVKLPKNIRQMGAPSGNRRIYMEDYVFTYLNQLAKPSNTYSRGAILLGEYKKNENGEVLFISGAIEAQNLELDLDETVFTNETWSEIYANIKEFFPDLSVVGWFLSRLGFSTSINDKIVKTHLDNFSGRDKVLYIIDALEGEDAFYLYEGNGLRKQFGYYIYYTKNEAMQNYIIAQNIDQEVEEEEAEATKKDQVLLKTYHEMMDRNKMESEPKRPQFIYVASAALTVAVLALSVTVINSYDRMKTLEVALNRMELAVGQTEQDADYEANVIEVGANITATDTEEDLGTDEGMLDDATEDGDATKEPVSEGATEEESQNSSEESTEVLDMANPVYYTVQEGDTLTSISLKMYNSIQYIQTIIEANNMENGDKLYIGQRLLIPQLAQ